jgi:hypothetical protein
MTTDSLHHLVPTFRRDSTEVIGAVRRSSVEFLGMEQMPGGKFQVTARTVSGADAFVSPVRTTLADGMAALEFARRSFGGEPLTDAVDEDGHTDASFAALTQQWETSAEELDEQAAEVRVEPRTPKFAFADIDVPELPTSVY